MKQAGLWLAAGILVGAGFYGLFSGGGLLLVAGLGLGAYLAFRYRRAARGWSGFVYGAGATAAVLLLPYVLHPPPCLRGSAGCFGQTRTCSRPSNRSQFRGASGCGLITTPTCSSSGTPDERISQQEVIARSSRLGDIDCATDDFVRYCGGNG